MREALYKDSQSFARAQFQSSLAQILQDVGHFNRRDESVEMCAVVKGPDGSPLTMEGTSNTNFVLECCGCTRVLCRVRQRNARTPPHAAARKAMLSEAVTYRLLHQAGLPVPDASFETLQVENVPASDAIPLYYLLGFAPGAMHAAFRNPDEVPLSGLTIDAIERIAEWYIALADHPSLRFASVGSPSPDDQGGVMIGQIVEEFPPLASAPYYLGPFPTAHARYYAHYDTVMRQILQGSRCTPSRALEEYLIALEMRTLVDGCSELQDAGPYYLKQGEDRGDHVLFDESGSISGVIDWEWTSTTCRADAFCAPVACLNWAFFEGDNSLCPREVALMEAYRRMGRYDLAECVKQGKKFQRLRSQILVKDTPDVGILNATRSAFLGEEREVTDKPQSRQEWVKTALHRYKDDQGIAELLSRQGSGHIARGS